MTSTTSISSVDGIRVDLDAVQVELSQAQDELIAALENGGTLASVKDLEQRIADLSAKRDDLLETTDFVIKRERQRASRDKMNLSTCTYLSQWGPDLQLADISPLILHAASRNEARGVTGILFVLRGWFASYLEGEEAAIDATLRRVAADSRHTKFAIVERHKGLPASTPRKFPDHSLAVKWLNDVGAHNHESTILHYLCQQLSLTAFVPRCVLSLEELLTRNQSGLVWDEVSETLQRRRQAEKTQKPVPSVPQYVVSIAPSSDAFWDWGDVLPEHLECVVACAKKVWERPTEESNYTAVGGDGGSTKETQQLGAVLGPHSSERLLIASGRFAGEALQRCLRFFSLLQADHPATYAVYRPTIVLHSGEVQAPVNGRVMVVGTMLRYLRHLQRVARQEGFPILTSETVVDELQRVGVSAVGHYLFEGRPDEVFAPVDLADKVWSRTAAEKEESTATIGDAAMEGGVPQTIRGAAVTRTSKPDDPPLTNDELNVQPPAGFVQESEVRAAFDALHPDPETDSIAMETYAAYLQTCDLMGVNEQVAEVEDRVSAFQPAKRRSGTNADVAAAAQPGPPAGRQHRRVNFDQFAMMWYRRLNA